MQNHWELQFSNHPTQTSYIWVLDKNFLERKWHFGGGCISDGAKLRCYGERNYIVKEVSIGMNRWVKFIKSGDQLLTDTFLVLGHILNS